MDRNTWNALSQFQTFDLVQRGFLRRHGRKLNADHTWEISACFIQGQQYFANASLADETVRPLLLCYGVLSISRGLILFLNAEAREATLKSSHGLRTGKWGEVFSRGIAHVLELDIRIEDGTYTELARATGNHVLISTVIGPIDTYEIAGFSPPLGDSGASNIIFDDALCRIPQLRTVYRQVTQTKSKVFVGIIRGSADTHIIRVAREPVSGMMTPEEVRSIFQVPEDVKIDAFGGDHSFRMPNFAYALPRPVLDKDLCYRPLCEGPADDGYLIAPWPNGGYMSPLLRSFVVAYFLGMVVRYYPSRWMALIRNAKGDATLPLLRQAIDHVENDFPRLSLDVLGIERFWALG